MKTALSSFVRLLCSDLRVLANYQTALEVPANTADPLPRKFVWMPAGEHEISANTADGQGWSGNVVCDEESARAVIDSFNKIKMAGGRVYLDRNHDCGEATAWVKSFDWQPGVGIICEVEWTPLGEQLLREKRFYSFSPEFILNKKTSKVSRLSGQSAGGLVNSPAFGAAMPALIAARKSDATSNTAPGGLPEQPSAMKDKLIKLLAKLKIQAPADATEEQLVALLEQHAPAVQVTASAATDTEVANLRNELATIRASAAKEKAEVAVQAAVSRGALADDKAVREKWVKACAENPASIELLASLPATVKPAASAVATDAAQVQAAAKKEGDALDITVDEGLKESLKLYAAEKDSKRRGVIYARKIDAAVGKFRNDVLRVMAANSLGSLAGNIIVQRYLSLLKFQFPFLKNITTDFSDVGANFNQTIVTRLRGVPSVSDFTPGTGYTRQNASATDVSITINKHKGAEIGFNVNELASTNRDLFGEQAEPQLYALGAQLVSDLLALIAEGAGAFGTAGSQATNIANAAAMSIGTLDTVSGALSDRKVSQMGRFALLDTSLFVPLRGDNRLVYLAGFQDRSIIEQMKVPNISGFDIHYAPYFPTGVAVNTDKVLHGFCGTSESLALATRVPNDYTQALPGAGYGNVSTITDPDTGISVALVQYVDHKLAETVQRVALMYGMSIGNKLTGQLISY